MIIHQRIRFYGLNVIGRAEVVLIILRITYKDIQEDKFVIKLIKYGRLDKIEINDLYYIICVIVPVGTPCHKLRDKLYKACVMDYF